MIQPPQWVRRMVNSPWYMVGVTIFTAIYAVAMATVAGHEHQRAKVCCDKDAP